MESTVASHAAPLTAQKLEGRKHVDSATVKQGSDGPYIDVEVTDTLAKSDLKREFARNDNPIPISI